MRVEMSRWPRLLGLVLAGVLALTACAGPGAPTGAADAAAGDRAAAPRPDLNFTVATLGGGSFDGRSLAGKPAALWFWAPWCPTCAVEAPHVRQIADQYAGKITVVGVAGLDEVAAMHRFVDLTNVDNITHLADEQGVVWRRFGVTAQSTYVLLDASGTIVHRGYLDEDDLDRILAWLAG
jgi:thiol-disulfide isomerase/thioredoxin